MKKLLSFPAANHAGTHKVIEKIYTEYLHKTDNFTVFLQGSLGAGKTYTVRELLKLFGVQEAITSPTYALMQEYQTEAPRTKDPKNQNNSQVLKFSSSQVLGFAHFDFYRLQDPAEFFTRGFSEIAEDPNVSCFVEWGDKIEPVAQKTFSGKKFIIRIEHGLGVGMRKITLFEKE